MDLVQLGLKITKIISFGWNLSILEGHTSSCGLICGLTILFQYILAQIKSIVIGWYDPFSKVINILW